MYETYVHNIMEDMFRSGGNWFLGSGHYLQDRFLQRYELLEQCYINVTIMVMVAFC